MPRILHKDPVVLPELSPNKHIYKAQFDKKILSMFENLSR